MKTQVASKISFLFNDKNNHPKATIKLYPMSVYGLSELQPTNRGLINANINENNKSVLDLYSKEVTTANAVLNIKKKNVVHIERILLSKVSHIKYLHDKITR